MIIRGETCNWLKHICLPFVRPFSRYSNTKPVYITTPIFYVNAVPHLGHLYTVVLADTLARWHQLNGKEVVLSTGTDEHGLKIQQAAEKQKMNTKDFCDEVSCKFKDMFSAASVGYSDFIRTSEGRHKDLVQQIWKKLCDRGYIYKGSYEGWYCISDEAFVPEAETTEIIHKDGKAARVYTYSGNTVEWMKEENYMFKLSVFANDLKRWLTSGNVIEPAHYLPWVTQWIDSGLPDLSVSRQRSRLHWGIPVPGDETQTIYVWLDALFNYMTVAGSCLWPADYQLVGKDILKFHAVYWPAFLMALDMEPPKQIWCHGHWTVDNVKMSKSLGNVVDPFEIIDKYTCDGVRYFLMRNAVPHSDCNFSESRLVECLNAELVNTLGNLLSRCTARKINPDQCFPAFHSELFTKTATLKDQELLDSLRNLPDQINSFYSSFEIYKAVDCIMHHLRLTNAFVQEHEPWELVKNPQRLYHLKNVLHLSLDSLRICTLLLLPIIPTLSNRVLDQLNIPVNERTLQYIKRRCDSDQCLGRTDSVLYQRIKSLKH